MGDRSPIQERQEGSGDRDEIRETEHDLLDLPRHRAELLQEHAAREHPPAHDALELTVRISRSRGEDDPPRSCVPLAKLYGPVVALHVPRRHPVGSVANAE